MEYALVLRWLVGFAVLWALGLPIAARLFRDLSGRGAGLALPVSLVVVTTVAYWVGLVSFGPHALAAGLAALVAASALAGVDLRSLRSGRVALAVAVDRRAVRDGALVFLVAFAFLVAVRAVDPAVHPAGGEKFLDYGLLKSLHRATALPPEDVWFAGEPVAYYYGGHLVSTLLAWLTATPPRFAYNLALAGFYAVLVTAVFDLAGAVAADRGGSRRAAGALAAFFVGLASNLATAAGLLLAALPAPQRRRLAQAVAERTEYTVEGILSGADSFSYWTASRVIPGTINEFPLFAWLNGDLHAHMMGTPFLVLVAALAYAYFRTPEGERGRRAALAFVAVPLVAGLQAVVDTWSLPTVFGVLWLAVTFAPAHPLSFVSALRGKRLRNPIADEVARPLAALVVAGVAGVLGAALGAPFLLGAASGPGRELALLAPTERSTLGALALVHGGFLLVFGAYLWSRLAPDRRWPLLVAVGLLGFVAVRVDLAVLALVGPLLVLSWIALRMGRPVGYETVLILAGAGLVGLVEVVYVVEEAGPLRLNTVFKTYMQVWVLWGVAAGVALAGLFQSAGEAAVDASRTAASGRVAGASSNGGTTNGVFTNGGATSGVSTNGGAAKGRFRPRVDAASVRDALTARPLVAGFVALLVVSTSVYGGLALHQHFSNPYTADPTLDATAFVGERHPEEAAAIRWLDAREGQPTIVSAPATRAYYGPGSGPDAGGAYTWLAFFTGDDAERRAFLAAHDVEYVWVGPAERDRYGGVEVGESEALSVAFSDGSVTVYRVEKSKL